MEWMAICIFDHNHFFWITLALLLLINIYDILILQNLFDIVRILGLAFNKKENTILWSSTIFIHKDTIYVSVANLSISTE